jgi:tetratricopeptide (TPR) repeat protein
MLSGIRTNDDDLLEAIEHIDNDDYTRALPILGRVVAFEPSNALAHELWVVCHIRVGRRERALELIDEGLARGMAVVGLNIQRSVVLRALGRLDEAADAARIALHANPESSQAVQGLAAVERARGSGEAAIQVYQEAVARLPHNEDVVFGLITLASEYGYHDLVVSSARDYLRRFERDAEVLSMLGQAYVALNDLRRADRAFRDAAHLDPEEVEHHVNVLIVSLLAGKENEFQACLKRLDSRDPELAEAAAQQAELLVARATDRRSG